jgi:hypothetical protein
MCHSAGDHLGNTSQTYKDLSVQLLPVLHVGRAGISVFPKEHQNLITEAHYLLTTVSLKYRARITKFQGDVPEALKDGISLVRLAMCTDHAKLAAVERIVGKITNFSGHRVLSA